MDQFHTNFSIHPETKIRTVTLKVTDLESQVHFYQHVLGFHLLSLEEKQAILGTVDQPLLHLKEHPGFKRYQQVTGLYHLAILFPDQRKLAKAVSRLLAVNYPNAPTDHIMTKSTYLDDPEGNGIELYAESPEDGTWFMEDDKYFARRTDGSLSNGREPLDLKALFSHLKDTDLLNAPLPTNSRIGHVHLHVHDIEEALDFYHGILGFDIMGKVLAYQMAFVSAGGYHHHIGLNTWQGTGAPPPPPGSLGLHHFSIQLPDRNEMRTIMDRVSSAGIPFERIEEGILLHDPSQNGVLLTS